MRASPLVSENFPALSPSDERDGALAALWRDIVSVVAGSGPEAPQLVEPADQAFLHVGLALRNAAGVPHDAAWRAAYVHLDNFLLSWRGVSGCAAQLASYHRLRTFLVENVDLADG